MGPGESETICLTLERNAPLVLLDDRAARRHAVSLGLPVMGTLGVLMASKRKGYIQAIKPVVDSLLDLGFRVAPGLRDQVLGDAGELA